MNDTPLLEGGGVANGNGRNVTDEGVVITGNGCVAVVSGAMIGEFGVSGVVALVEGVGAEVGTVLKMVGVLYRVSITGVYVCVASRV